MKKLPFTKMQGIGNDFVLLNMKDILSLEIKLNNKFVRKICNRNFGIGSDGLVILDKSDIADFKYIMYNPDGSIAEMCGNGIRCFMKYLSEENISEEGKITVETGAGILTLEMKNDSVTVNMGTPKLSKDDIGIPDYIDITGAISSANREFRYSAISMGNPHAVIFIDEKVKDFDLNKYGGPIEKNTSYFTNKINVEFIEIVSDVEINLRVYERGAGETLACGTGACAGVVAGIIKGRLKTNEDIKVNLTGGILYINWSGDIDDGVIMKGPAETVFKGKYLFH